LVKAPARLADRRCDLSSRNRRLVGRGGAGARHDGGWYGQARATRVSAPQCGVDRGEA
jgi:hypothetical protein